MHELLNDVGISVLAATILGLVAHWCRQPIILGYLVAGAVIGPQIGLQWVHGDSVEIISEIGLILLLFVIGLEMNVKSLLESGKQLLASGFGQFPICVALGLLIFPLLGFGLKGEHSEGLYFALLCALSSTAVVVKLLYDKGELDTLPGRMTLGALVIQDIYAIFILAFQPNFANPSFGPVAMALLGTCGLLTGGFLFSRYVLKYVFASVGRAPEMVVAVSIGWCAAVAIAAGALGLSKEMGALVAGLSIAAFPYSVHVTAKTLPLRDFFLTLFFMSLGMKITMPQWSMMGLVFGLIAFVVASRFLSTYPLLALTGAGRRTAFITSLNLSQISEFSLVIASLGVAYKHISPSTVTVLIYAMAIMAVLSSYAIRYNHQLFLAFDRLIVRFGGRSQSAAADAAGHRHAWPIVLLGMHRGGRALVDLVSERRPELLSSILVIDFSTEVLNEMRQRGVGALFGDLSSMDTLEHAHIGQSRLILSLIPDMLLKGTDNATIVRMCRAIAPAATIVATADNGAHERRLRSEGAAVTVRPHLLVAQSLVEMLSSAASEKHQSLQTAVEQAATAG